MVLGARELSRHTFGRLTNGGIKRSPTDQTNDCRRPNVVPERSVAGTCLPVRALTRTSCENPDTAGRGTNNAPGRTRLMHRDQDARSGTT